MAEAGEKCGTYGGYQRHRRDSTLVTCRWCLRAYAEYMREYRMHRKCAPGLGWPMVARRG